MLINFPLFSDSWFRNEEVYGDHDPSDQQRRGISESNGGVGIGNGCRKGGRILATKSDAKGGAGSMTTKKNARRSGKNRKDVATFREKGGADSMSDVSKLEESTSDGGVELHLGQTGEVARSADALQVLDVGHLVDMNAGGNRRPSSRRKESSTMYRSTSAQEMPTKRRGRGHIAKKDVAIASKRSAAESRASISKKQRTSCGVS